MDQTVGVFGGGPIPVNDVRSPPELSREQRQDCIVEVSGYDKKASVKKIPVWGEKLIAGAKIAGLGVGAVVGGALAIGLLPLTIAGVVFLTVAQDMKKSSEKKHKVPHDEDAALEIHKKAEQMKKTAKILYAVGVIAAMSLVGCVSCVIAATNIVSLEVAKHAAHEVVLAEAGPDKKQLQKQMNAFNLCVKNLTKRQKLEIKRYIRNLQPEHSRKIDEHARRALLHSIK